MTESTIDTRFRENTRHLQLERLQMLLNRAYLNVDFYRQRMDELRLLPEDVTSFEDFQHFPFTTSEDLARHYPYGLFAVPLKSVVRLKVTHCKDGSPIVIGFTRGDVSAWQTLMTKLYGRLGIIDRDIVQVAFNYSLFPGAFTFNHAAEQIGATLAPSATVSATLQLKIMQDFRSTVLATTPSFAMHILDTLQSRTVPDVDFRKLDLRMILLGPEPVPEQARTRLQEELKVSVHSLYGVNEMVEPGIAGECPKQAGFHLAEDHFLAEIVHPVTGTPLPAGQEGELVLTTLRAEAYPLIRYRTGDITVLHEVPCSCGRTSARLSPILRRTDSRISVRGIPFYPEQVGEALRQLDPSVEDFRVVIHKRWGLGDRLEVLITRRDGNHLPNGGKSAYLEKIRVHFRRALGLGARVALREKERLPMEGLVEKTVFVESDV